MQIIQILLLLTLFWSCTNQDVNHRDLNEASSDSGTVILNSNQIRQTQIIVGSIQKQLLSETIECVGSIEPDPNNHAVVSPPIDAYIKSIKVQPGEYIEAGDHLAILEHPEIVKIQQKYLEVKSQYDYYKEDFMRQGELSIEQAASLKTMQKAQNEFRKTEAELRSLSAQLEFLNLNPDSINVDEIQTKIYLQAPISGYVTKIDAKLGLLCREETALFEIINAKNALLHLEAPEKVSKQISSGQILQFHPVTDGSKLFTASVKYVTKSINSNNSVSVHCSIVGNRIGLMPGMFVKAAISIMSDSLYAIKKSSIASYQGKNYIFTQEDSTHYKQYEIETGRIYLDWIELKNPDAKILEKNIVIDGAYYLQAAMQKEE